MQHPILAAALEYARLGYRVIPLKPGTKVPDLRHWPEEASNDPAIVAKHFESSRARAQDYSDGTRRSRVFPNVGIVTGNGLAVLDIDTGHGGERPEWAVDTLTVRTASGGLHLYYAVDRPVPNSVGRIGRGIDIRGERGQVAAPPSVIYDRRPVNDTVFEEWVHEYRLENDRPIASIDASLLIPADEQQCYLGRPARRFAYRESVPVGERNNYLTSLAGYLFAIGSTREEVQEGIELESNALGFTPKPGELTAIVASVARYHEGPAI